MASPRTSTRSPSLEDARPSSPGFFYPSDRPLSVSSRSSSTDVSQNEHTDLSSGRLKIHSKDTLRNLLPIFLRNLGPRSDDCQLVRPAYRATSRRRKGLYICLAAIAITVILLVSIFSIPFLPYIHSLQLLTLQQRLDEPLDILYHPPWSPDPP